MIDAVAAATAAVTLITPALADMARDAAGHPGEAADDKLIPWLHHNLTGRAQVALTELAARPDSEARQSVLREELLALLRQEPALLADLAALLPAHDTNLDIETHTIEAEGAIGALTRGNTDTMR
jgi:hypothetical protein